MTQGAYLEDQLTWDWGPEGEETEKQICPPHTEHGGEQWSVRLKGSWEYSDHSKASRGQFWDSR